MKDDVEIPVEQPTVITAVKQKQNKSGRAFRSQECNYFRKVSMPKKKQVPTSSLSPHLKCTNRGGQQSLLLPTVGALPVGVKRGSKCRPRTPPLQRMSGRRRKEKTGRIPNTPTWKTPTQEDLECFTSMGSILKDNLCRF